MFDFMFSPQGRISRKGWWLGYMLPYLGISIVCSVLEEVVPVLAFVSVLVGLFYLWPGLVAVPVKRFHDLGMTGFWQLGFAVLNIGLTVALFAGIAFGLRDGGRLGDLQAMSTLGPEEQQALWADLFPMIISNPVAIISAVLFVVVALAYLFFMGIKKGIAGPNVHGDDPLLSGRGFSN